MGRFTDYDDGEHEPGAEGRWRGQVASQIRGKRGQAFLRELLTSLEALPEKRLIEGAIAEDGCVCALGSIALKRRTDAGEDREKVLSDLERIVVDVESEDFDEDIGEWARGALAAPELLASHIPWVNDDGGHRWVGNDPKTGRCIYEPITPEERWERMVKWTKSQIKEPTP